MVKFFFSTLGVEFPRVLNVVEVALGRKFYDNAVGFEAVQIKRGTCFVQLNGAAKLSLLIKVGWRVLPVHGPGVVAWGLSFQGMHQD